MNAWLPALLFGLQLHASPAGTVVPPIHGPAWAEAGYIYASEGLGGTVHANSGLGGSIHVNEGVGGGIAVADAAGGSIVAVGAGGGVVVPG